MMKAGGVLIALLGLVLMKFSREGEGIVGVILFLLGLALTVIGGYLVFFEDGQGLARWLPFLSP